MELIVGTNTYITLEEAESYFSGRINASAWVDNSEKEKLLITATNLLEDMSWKGDVVSDTQLLAFPRKGVYYEPRLKREVDLSSEMAKKRLIQAICETAISIIDNNPFEAAENISTLTVGPITLSGMKASGKRVIPSVATDVLNPLVSDSKISNAWWRAN